MVDISELIVWSTIVQTIVLSLTLVIFALSFRSQNKAIQEQAYQKVMDDYGDAMRMLSERPELYAFQLELFNRSRLPLGREATTSSCSTDSSKESTSSTDGNGLTRTLGSNGQRFSKLLPHTLYSGRSISRPEKCSTSHSKTMSLESSAARNETDYSRFGNRV